MSDKKRDIIFEVPKAGISPSVQALMDNAEARLKEADEALGDFLGEPLEIDFHIKNNRVLFSMPDSGLSAPSLVAKSIIKAVKEYAVEAIQMDPKELPSARVGSATVKYDRFVRIDWNRKTIFTNFPPSEGQTFLGAMAIVVGDLQSSGPKVAEEQKS